MTGIVKPVEDARCPIKLTSESVALVVQMSGGYPYFIQFICRAVFDVFIQGETEAIPVEEITRKLDSNFLRAGGRKRPIGSAT